MSKYLKIVLIVVLMLLVAYVAIAFVVGKPKVNSDDVKGVFNAIIDPSPVNQPCEIEDEISYLYYTEHTGSKKNNKFGLYIYAEEERFIKLADQLVNSNGGDWGYVLIPFNVRDRDSTRWRRVFTQLREKHLIPVIQLHDVDPDNYKEETKDAVEFLDSFIWPIKQRYISVYNEPNDARFWYGYVDPAEYARILNYTITTFKEENADFKIMNGALNVSAPTHSDGTYMESFEYMRRMDEEIPGIFNRLDAWASHPYPMPDFRGNPLDSGRWSIRAYEEELRYLEENLDVARELPVFITETGWAHAEGDVWNSNYLQVQEVAENFKIAYEEVWLKDDRVVAVMPFTIRYNPPFDHFSWVDNRNVPYAHFQMIKSLKKVAGTPAFLAEESTKSLECK